MLTLYFCLDDKAPILRYWPAVPRIGEMVSLPELGGNLRPLKVHDVIWEGFDDPSVTVWVQQAKIEHGVSDQSANGLQRNRFQHLDLAR